VAVEGETVRLRDGSNIRVRQVVADDKELLRRTLEELTPESRYRRFLMPKDRFTGAELAYLTEVDHRDHEALVATTEAGNPVGVGRYVRLTSEPAAAEAAVAVVDAWHRRGVATALLERLRARALAAGIDRFRATCFASSHDVIDLLTHLGAKPIRPAEPGLVEFELPLAEPGTLHGTLRRAASEELNVRPPTS
jgi:GNAT superfamily N-acetyltransferase